MDKPKRSVIGNRRSSQRNNTANSQTNKPTNRNKNLSNSYGHPTHNKNSRNIKKKRSRKSFRRRIFKYVTILTILFIGYFVYTINFAGLHPKLSGESKRYGISSEAAAFAKNRNIVNIAIFGVDAREGVDGSRSDAMMIATADYKHQSIKLTSLLRDTYVYINAEESYDKLNAAFAIGGAETALKTVNENFDTAITDYITIDFTCMVEMVNAVGGVDIDIKTEDELYWTNQYIMDVNDKVKTSSPDVPGTGLQKLDGSQALAYTRVRYAGNSDFERTQRQRLVLEQTLKKILKLNPISQFALYNKIKPYIQTSLSQHDIVKYGGRFIGMRNSSIKQQQIPCAEFLDTGTLYDVSYVFPNTLEENIVSMYWFIYEEAYTPSPRSQEISAEIEKIW